MLLIDMASSTEQSSFVFYCLLPCKHGQPDVLFRLYLPNLYMSQLVFEPLEYLLELPVFLKAVATSVYFFSESERVNQFLQLVDFILVGDLLEQEGLLTLELVLVLFMTHTKHLVDPLLFDEQSFLQLIEKLKTPKDEEAQVDNQDYCEEEVYRGFIQID